MESVNGIERHTQALAYLEVWANHQLVIKASEYSQILDIEQKLECYKAVDLEHKTLNQNQKTYIKINKTVDFDFFVPLELTLHNQPYLLDWFLSSYIASSPHNLNPSGACTAIMHPPYIS